MTLQELIDNLRLVVEEEGDMEIEVYRFNETGRDYQGNNISFGEITVSEKDGRRLSLEIGDN